jgi:hypothetical protein
VIWTVEGINEAVSDTNRRPLFHGGLPRASNRPAPASVLQASAFRWDVTVFRLRTSAGGQSGSEPAFRRNTAERAYAIDAAHNPEVAGSNPAPATEKGSGNRAFLLHRWTRFRRLERSCAGTKDTKTVSSVRSLLTCREGWSASVTMTDTRRTASSSLESNAEQPQAYVAAYSRVSLIAAALRLSFFTIAWNGLIGASAFVISLVTGSLALAGFGLNALLDSPASAVLVWRFMHERRDPLAADRVERQVQAVVVVAMMAVGLYVAVEAVRALVGGSHADESALGFVLAAVSVLVLPWLGTTKAPCGGRAP